MSLSEDIARAMGMQHKIASSFSSDIGETEKQAKIELGKEIGVLDESGTVKEKKAEGSTL